MNPLITVLVILRVPTKITLQEADQSQWLIWKKALRYASFNAKLNTNQFVRNLYDRNNVFLRK